MAKILTDTKIKNLKPKEIPYVESDGQGLQLLIKPTGTKLWEFRYTSPTQYDKNGNKKRRKTSFGSYPETTLKIARDKRAEYLEMLSIGIDPTDKKNDDEQKRVKKKNNNFKIIAEQWLEFEEQRMTPRAFKRKKAIVVNDAYPYLQKKSIEDITHQDIIKVLKERLSKKIHASEDNENPPDGIETANKLYNHLNTIFKYAITIGLAEKNPFDNILKELIIPKADTTHYAKITETDGLKNLINDIYNYNGHYSTVNALKLGIHLPLRASNLTNLLWEYIDFEDRSLTIPRNLMKVKNKNLPNFKVPLSDEVINILKEQYEYTSHQKYVFLSVNNQVLNSNTPNVALQRMGYRNKQTLHGFRGIYRSLVDTYQNEHNISYEVKKRFLDHHESNKVELAYNHRADFFEQMRPLAKWWSNYLNNLLNSKNGINTKGLFHE
ncbi:tyrosine-type recombinase/integrase [Aliarcobacter butzleri]|uniref:tyrosine-type recombinase/integrase n=1 Tax=Aliarcobacter butzleri TaxID=28197 RepID=UPI002B24C815|nr:integrase arm-type DNA-binding domain-containing protein [Aliarcobacter butzleri]